MVEFRRSRRTVSRTAPVEVRSINDPKPGWDVSSAVALLEQGYSAEQAERLSGFAAAFLRAQRRLRSH